MALQAVKITYNLEGANEILDALDGLPERVIQNIITAVGRQALRQHVIAPVRSALPYTNIVKSKDITITGDRRDKSLWAGPTTDAWRLRFVEKGTKERYAIYRNKRKMASPAYRGSISPNPKLTPVVEASPPSIINFFNIEFGNEVEKQLLKRIKKIKK